MLDTMSDDELMDNDDYDLEYDDSEPDVEADLENQYYNSKTLKEDDPDAALAAFLRVLQLEEEKGDWGFKALKQMMKIEFHLGRFTQMMEHYQQLLTYIKVFLSYYHHNIVF